MLEKKDFISFCDAHFHLVQCAKFQDIETLINENAIFYGCTCSHEKDEFAHQKKLLSTLSLNNCVHLKNSFGIHPQLPIIENADFLEQLLLNGEIGAIGESGFDLYTESFKENIVNQEKAWNIQLELAKTYNKTLIIHCRKGLELIFRDSSIIKNIPAVLFHSFCGGVHEANGILGKGINAFFSFGKQIMNGNKKSIDCTTYLPIDRFLLETDAPFQTLKGEKFTKTSDIINIYNNAFELRKENKTFLGEKIDFNKTIQKNFSCLFK